MSTSYLVFLVVIPLACYSGPSDFSFPCGSELTSHPNWKLLDTSNICGVGSPSSVAPRILGGTMAQEGEYPWMAIVKNTDDNGTSLCGGAIINERYILTAAHCVVSPRKLLVRVGEFDWKNFTDCSGVDCHAKNIVAESYISHERYDKGAKKNDIALIRLKENIQFDDYKLPICLPTSCDLVNKNFEDTTLLLAGWGRNDQHGNFSHDGPLRKVQLVASSIEDCRKLWFPRNIILRSQICTWASKRGGGVEGGYSGDSGSPLVYKDSRARHYAIGVATYVGATHKNVSDYETWLALYEWSPPVYARVAFYMTWILDNIKP